MQISIQIKQEFKKETANWGHMKKTKKQWPLKMSNLSGKKKEANLQTVEQNQQDARLSKCCCGNVEHFVSSEY